VTAVTPGLPAPAANEIFSIPTHNGGVMRSLVLVLISMRILFGLWSGVSRTAQTRGMSLDRTALILPR